MLDKESAEILGPTSFAVGSAGLFVGIEGVGAFSIGS
jgi:hypothetical protein